MSGPERLRFLLAQMVGYFDDQCHALCGEYGHGPDLDDPVRAKDVAWCLGGETDDLATYREARAMAGLSKVAE